MIESQNFVMTNLRNGIDYLKATCKNAGDGDGLLFLILAPKGAQGILTFLSLYQNSDHRYLGHLKDNWRLNLNKCILLLHQNSVLFQLRSMVKEMGK